MKIIYYSPHPHLNLQDPAGYGTHMREMIRAFKELGHEVLPVIAGGMEKSSGQPVDFNAPSFKNFIKKFIPAMLWQSLKDRQLLKFDKGMRAQLEQKILDFQPDFVYERANYMQLSGLELCQGLDLPHFYEFNAPYVDEKLRLEGNTWYKKRALEIEKKQITQTNKAFVVTSALQEYFHNTYQLKAAPIGVLPNAINPKRFVIEQSKVDALKKEYSFETGEMIIGFVGSILKWHGLDLLVKAFANIAPNFPKAKLLIVGDGESLPQIKSLAIEHKVQERVVFTGNVKHEAIPNLIEAMDITVMANTNWYGSPVKLFEYGALQKAIIAPDNSCVRDVMEPEKDGILVKPKLSSLEDALKRMLENNILRKELASHFHQKVMEQHTWIKNAEFVLREYQQLEKTTQPTEKTKV